MLSGDKGYFHIDQCFEISLLNTGGTFKTITSSKSGSKRLLQRGL